MATVQLGSVERVVLFDEHVFGRSARCDTQVQDEGTSSRHALIYWDGALWRVRDLGSTNGTILDGQALSVGDTPALAVGSKICWGGEEETSVLDLLPPNPSALSLDSPLICTGTASLVLVPSEEEPDASFVLQNKTQWWFEHAGKQTPVVDGDVVQWKGQRLRLFAGRGLGATQVAEQALTLSDVFFDFRVSLDEEHVRLSLRHDGGSLDLGSRAHHYTTLQLARLRQADARLGQAPDSSHGWIDGQELMRQLGSSETKLSVEVCRIRSQLAKLGISDAADVIERRRGTRQLRLGTARFEITRE